MENTLDNKLKHMINDRKTTYKRSSWREETRHDIGNSVWCKVSPSLEVVCPIEELH